SYRFLGKVFPVFIRLQPAEYQAVLKKLSDVSPVSGFHAKSPPALVLGLARAARLDSRREVDLAQTIKFRVLAAKSFLQLFVKLSFNKWLFWFGNPVY